MACPFSAFRTRQPSVASEAHNWAIEEDVGEDDSLTLKHLNAAIQLLTVPSVSIQLKFLSKINLFEYLERGYSGSSPIIEG